MSITLPPPPFKTTVTDKTGQMTPTWQRHVLATQQTVASDVAPADARYLVATGNPSLTAEVNLGALAAGYLKQTVAAGVASPSTTATIPASDLTGALPALDGSALTALNASALSSGTVPDARLGSPLPALSGANLTALNASQLTSGTLPDARLGSPLPALSGVNLTALKGINVTHSVVTKVFADSPYTVLSSDETILVDATAGAVSVTLPAATAGRMLVVKKIDASANAVTLTGTVDGTVNPTLAAQWQSRIIQGAGSSWNILGQV